MPLWLLATIVVIGLGAVWLAMRLFGFTRELVLDEAVARAEFAADNPGLDPGEIVVAGNGRAALVRADGGLHLMWVMGLDAASHGLRGAEVAAEAGALFVRLHDFAAPHVRLTLSPGEVAQWRVMIEAAA